MMGPKRIAKKRLVANRANARLCTGPRVPEGSEARSRWNALTHGALAQAVIPPSLEPDESRQTFDDLLAGLHDEFAPASTMARFLVERIATAYWRLARLVRAEAASVAIRQDEVERDDARAARLDHLYPLLVNRPSPQEQQVNSLASTIGNKRHLRSLMVAQDPALADADDAQIRLAAEERLAALGAELDAARTRQLSPRRDVRSTPPIDRALLYTRYDAALERQLYRALDALERLQRRRDGEHVSPPVRLDVDAAVQGLTGALAQSGRGREYDDDA